MDVRVYAKATKRDKRCSLESPMAGVMIQNAPEEISRSYPHRRGQLLFPFRAGSFADAFRDGGIAPHARADRFALSFTRTHGGRKTQQPRAVSPRVNPLVKVHTASLPSSAAMKAYGCKSAALRRGEGSRARCRGSNGSFRNDPTVSKWSETQPRLAASTISRIHPRGSWRLGATPVGAARETMRTGGRSSSSEYLRRVSSPRDRDGVDGAGGGTQGRSGRARSSSPR